MASQLQRMMAQPEKKNGTDVSDKGKDAARNDRRHDNRPAVRRHDRPDTGGVSAGAGDLPVRKRPVAQADVRDVDAPRTKDDGMAQRSKKTVAAKSARAAEGEKDTYSLLIRDVPVAMKRRLEATRAKRGYRAVNATVLELLDEGAEK
jgi:hypothetical protein